MGNFAENLNLGNRVRPPLHRDKNKIIIIMWFYTVSHGKFHDRGYSDILCGINNINISWDAVIQSTQ